MNRNYGIWLIAILLISSFVMIVQDAYALIIESTEPDGSAGSILETVYMPSKDYLVSTETTGGFTVVHVVNASSLVQVAEITTEARTVDGLRCTATVCFVAGQHDLAPNHEPSVTRINMVTLTISAMYAESDYNSCQITNMEPFGTSLYISMADFGGCPYTGMYTLPINFVADSASSNQWVQYDDSTTLGDTSEFIESCLVSGRYFFMLHDGSDVLRRYDLNTMSIASSATYGASPTSLACPPNADFSSDSVYVSSIAGDWVKRIDMSTLTIEADSISMTNPNELVVKGDSLYVSRSDATTITVAEADNLNNNFVMIPTGELSHNGNMFGRGNATRLNIISPTANDNIYYSIHGLFDPDAINGTNISTSFCIDINPNNDHAGDLVCYSDVNGDGIPDVSNGVIGLINNNQDITQGGQSLLCQIGIQSVCDNDDPLTNGVGYLYWFVLFMIMAVIGATAFEGNKKNQAHIMLYIVIMVASGFIAYAFGWIDLTLPIVSIIIVAGFASVKLANMVEGKIRGGDD